ncbi:MAG: cyclic pyranopterin monophosphate synthase MoaC [Synergistaceae bacterium]|jgi:cyclic pyranopterin phosphate synthase|nr:cyclic pyranopterin monophosphate synthase MoaC [Synergistaceae bacterium]
MSDLTHFDGDGRPRMVDIGDKTPTRRTALAEGWVELPDAIYDALKEGKVVKGDPIPVAELGGIMGAKRTSDLIPLCHSIKLDSVRVRCKLSDEEKSLHIVCEAASTDATGVEMEALTGVSVAALVFYDMCKALDKGMTIRNVRLIEKSGGRSGRWRRQEV